MMNQLGVLKRNTKDITVRMEMRTRISYDVLKPEIGDFNGDGKSDVLLVDARFHGIDKSGYRLFISNGSSLVYKSERVLTETAENKFFEQPKGIGDFNGDGKADLFFHYKAGNGSKLLVYHSDGENLNPTCLIAHQTRVICRLMKLTCMLVILMETTGMISWRFIITIQGVTSISLRIINLSK